MFFHNSDLVQETNLQIVVLMLRLYDVVRAAGKKGIDGDVI